MAVDWKTVTSVVFQTVFLCLGVKHFSYNIPAAHIKLYGYLIFYSTYIWLEISYAILFYRLGVNATHLPEVYCWNEASALFPCHLKQKGDTVFCHVCACLHLSALAKYLLKKLQ